MTEKNEGLLTKDRFERWCQYLKLVPHSESHSMSRGQFASTVCALLKAAGFEVGPSAYWEDEVRKDQPPLEARSGFGGAH